MTILTLTKGDTGPFTVPVAWQTLANVDGLASYTGLSFIGKLSKTDPDTAAVPGGPGAVFIKTLADGLSVTTDGNNTDTDGVVTIALDPADTSGLPDLLGAVTIYCSLKGNDGSSHQYTILKDVLLVVSLQATSKATL